MTRSREYDPYEHAARLGINVVLGRLRSANGLWIPEEHTVILKQGMRRLLERSVLAHEIGHAVLGHPDDSPRNERQADRYAARQLINPERLTEVARYSPDPGQWCVDLQVTPHLLETFLSLSS